MVGRLIYLIVVSLEWLLGYEIESISWFTQQISGPHEIPIHETIPEIN